MRDSNPWIIYALVNPATSAVKYIGKTHQGLERRCRQHIADAKRGQKTHKGAGIRSLLRDGIDPEWVVLEQGVGNGWEDAERKWIAVYAWTGDLWNETDGGEGQPGRVVSLETRMKMSASQQKRTQPEDVRAKISRGLMGHVVTEETRLRQSEAQKRRFAVPISQETRSRISDANKRRWEAWRQRRASQ